MLYALAFSVAGGLVWLLLESAAGAIGSASPQPKTDGLYVALLCLQMGYFVAAAPLVLRARLRCYESVAGQLKEGAAGLEELKERFTGTHKSGLPWAVLPALALTITTQEVQFARFSGWWSSPGWALGELWTVLAAWATWTTALWLIARIIIDVSAIRRLGQDYVVIDLMRIEPLVAFSRYGLQLTGLVVGIIALWAIIAVMLTSFLMPDGIGTSRHIVFFMLVLYLAITLAAFVYPQLGIRRNMHQHKGLAADKITQQLPFVKQGELATGFNPEQYAAMLAVRSHIQTLPDWPIGQHTRLRLVLYLFIPLFSWVAAALVEELVSNFLL